MACLALSVLAGGCRSTQPHAPQRGTVTYTLSGGEPIITAFVTPFDSNPAAREAYLFWFKRGFAAGLQQTLELWSWERTEKGDAASSGYIHGYEEGAKVRAEAKGSAPGQLR